MVADLFIEVLKHIQKYTICSNENKILLLLDNHTSHISVDSITFAKNNGIVVLSFPPHCTHRLQPLDVGVFGPFKSALKVAFNNFNIEHPGTPLTIKNIGMLSRDPFLNAFNMKNIQSAFKKTGLWPVNQLIFTDEEFEAAYATDRPLPESVLDPPIEAADNFGNDQNKSLIENVETISQQQMVAGPSGITTIENIRPFPKAGPRKSQSKRYRPKSTIYTDSPEKQRLEEMANSRNKKKTNKAVIEKPRKKPAPVVFKMVFIFIFFFF